MAGLKTGHADVEVLYENNRLDVKRCSSNYTHVPLLWGGRELQVTVITSILH